MVFVNKSYEQMLREVDFQKIAVEDTISPKNNPECFKRIRFSGTDCVFLTNRYVKSLYVRAGIKYDDYAFATIVNEQVSNMIQRGHKGDKTLEAKIKIARGLKGGVLRFEDSGKGFDCKKKTYEQGGAGRDVFSMKGIEACYENPGNILNIMIMNKN